MTRHGEAGHADDEDVEDHVKMPTPGGGLPDDSPTPGTSAAHRQLPIAVPVHTGACLGVLEPRVGR
jgi:hypothetical protein